MDRSPTPDLPTHVPVTWTMRAWVLLSGVLYALANPFSWPGNLDDVTASLHRPAWLLAFVCLVPLQWHTRKMGAWQAYLFSAWAFVPGTFLLLYWLIIAMNVFGGIPLVFSALLLLLLSAVGWNFMATGLAVGRRLQVHHRWPAMLAMPVGWTGMEMCRAYVYFGGFPWGNLGTTQWNNPLVAQLAALGGVYAIEMVLVMVNVVIVETLRWRAGERDRPDRAWWVAAAVMSSVVAWGTFHLVDIRAHMARAPHVRVGMLQGNIEQGIKNKDMQHQDLIVQKYARLQAQALVQGAEVVVWPEGALPAYIGRLDESMRGRHVPPLGGAVGIIGTTVMWREPPTKQGEECRGPRPPHECRGMARLHNSAVVVDGMERILGRFDKTHLVPFGEYVPWPLGYIARAIVPSIGAFVPGDRLVPVETPTSSRARVGALVCYEGIFPQYARHLANQGTHLLVNVTNDAWYGISSAAPQHLAFYSMRAVENGRSVARVANTGITAGIDPTGAVHNASRLYEDAAVIADLPLLDVTTPYMVIKDGVGVLCALFFLYALGGGLRQAWLDRGRRRSGKNATA